MARQHLRGARQAQPPPVETAAQRGAHSLLREIPALARRREGLIGRGEQTLEVREARRLIVEQPPLRPGEPAGERRDLFDQFGAHRDGFFGRPVGVGARRSAAKSIKVVSVS